MKTVYFIRHGQSEGNVSLRIQQGPHTALTPQGIEQAKIVAKHMKKFPLQVIIASTFARAQATAEELSHAAHVPVEKLDLFIEGRRPGLQLRKRKNNPRWLWTQMQLAFFSRFSWYRHSDEETPEDVLQRAHEALVYLASRPEETIAVVTHGRFMRALYAAMTLGEEATGRTYLLLTRTLTIRNTALMVANYDQETWSVAAWNADAATI